MTFLNPGFLWLLSGLPLVFALYFLKSRPTKRLVSSNAIWKIVIDRIKPNSFFQRFQNSIFLLLQTLAILFAIFSLARPLGFGLGEMDRIIILDVSASMQAKDIQPSRLAKALERARILCSKHRGGNLAIYLLGDKLVQLVPLVNTPTPALRALEKVQPTHCSSPTSERLIRMIRELDSFNPDEIFILTDTFSLGFPSDFMPRTSIFVEIFANSGSNVAIVDAEANLDSIEKSTSVRLTLVNENSDQVYASLQVEGKTSPSTPFWVTLPPFQRTFFTFPELPLPPLTFIISTQPRYNVSEADDRWYISDPELRPKVILDAPPDSILFQLKSALPLVEFIPFSGGLIASDIVGFISKGSLPIEAKNISTCAFLEGSKNLSLGEILPWNTEHPLLRYTNWDAVATECLKPSVLPGLPLVEAVGGSLVSEELEQTKFGQLSHVWISFNPDHPTLSGNIFLPVFLFNLLEYLMKDNFPRLWYGVGHPGLSALWKGKSPLVAGFHSIPGRSGQIAINLQAPNEANISPGFPKKPNLNQSSLKQLKEQSASPWEALLCIALIFILGEWYLFMRRN